LGDATKLYGDLGVLSTPDLLSLNSGGRKKKRTVRHDKRLTLCHAKVKGYTETKALVSPWLKC